jgi:hypothetical protein
VLAIGAQDRTVDGILAYLASRAHGVVTRGELAGAGVTRAEIERRLRNGALIRVHRGVFRVGHQSPSLEARYIAAVKACGEGSLLAGSAAARYTWLDVDEEPAPMLADLRQLLASQGTAPSGR